MKQADIMHHEAVWYSLTMNQSDISCTKNTNQSNTLHSQPTSIAEKNSEIYMPHAHHFLSCGKTALMSDLEKNV